MTDKQKFSNYMKKQGFKIEKAMLMGTLSLIPKYRVSDKGEHTLIREMKFVDFDGSDTIKGELGCVALFYYGMSRQKHKKHSNVQSILKKVFCPKSYDEAVKVFEQWKIDTAEILESWKVIFG